MAQIRPFTGIRYVQRDTLDLSRVIAPPYDVLDSAGKAALQARHPNNVVTIDLPHMPPKSAGPDAVYAQAAITMKAWDRAGILAQDSRPSLYPYTQSFDYGGRTFHRRGLIALVKLSPFGGGHVVPHEKTHEGAIEDRMKLMRATGVQLSPIFGLYSDPANQLTSLLYHDLGRPAQSATLDGVRSDLWAITDGATVNKAIDLMQNRPIYIADGHHRYTTALQYQAEVAKENGGTLPPQHPANWCMFVLVGMQDPGLLILPTHRLIGGLTSFDMGQFRAAVGSQFEVTETTISPDQLPQFINDLPRQARHTLGLYDGATKKTWLMRLTDLNVLQDFEPSRSEAWRRLDVAILQRYIIEEILTPRFADGKDPARGYTADPAEVAKQVDGEQYQIALLLQPTPLHALEELGQHGEVMPQKSTYFFPKLATGMVINPLKYPTLA